MQNGSDSVRVVLRAKIIENTLFFYLIVTFKLVSHVIKSVTSLPEYWVEQVGESPIKVRSGYPLLAIPCLPGYPTDMNGIKI